MNTKKCLVVLTLVLSAFSPLGTRAQSGAATESDPAYLPIDRAIDLKTIRPEVNVNLPRFLLQDAVSELDGGTNDPFAAAGLDVKDLIKDVKLIRVLVFDTDATNKAALAKGIASLREILERQWTPLATVPEENVGVYALGDAKGESMAGLAVLVHDGGDAVIANIVGRVSIGKVIKLASRFDKFPKELLEKLMGGDGGAKPKQDKDGKPATASAPESGGAKTKSGS